MATTKKTEPDAPVTEEDVRQQDAPEGLTVATPATETRLTVGQKVTFTPEGKDDQALGTVAAVSSDDEQALVQWGGQEAWLPAKNLVIQP